MIDITGINKAELVAALFNNSKPLNFGFFASGSKTKMTIEKAQEHLDRGIASGNTYIDYLEGRVMKLDVSGATLDPSMYDRDNGVGAAKKVVDAVRASRPVAFQAATSSNELERLAASGDVENARKLADSMIEIRPVPSSAQSTQEYCGLKSGFLK